MADEEAGAADVADFDDDGADPGPDAVLHGQLGAFIRDYQAVDAWLRQPGEPVRAYHAFCHYRDLGSKRSGVRAYRVHKLECEHTQNTESIRAAPYRWAKWSVDWGWIERVEIWDADVDRQARERSVKEAIEARVRHGRLAQGTMTALSPVVRAMLDALQDPSVMAGLTAKARGGAEGALSLIRDIARVAQVIPALVAVERLSLGLSAEMPEQQEPRDDSSFATRVVQDPQATELAIALLDRIAGTGAHPALGPGPSSEPGPVANGAPPKPPHP